MNWDKYSIGRNYGYDMEYLGKWINKEDKNMPTRFTFRGIDYDINVPEGVIITLRTINIGDRIPDKLLTEKDVDFEYMYEFFRDIMLKQLHEEGYRIVRDYQEHHVGVARNSGRYPWGEAEKKEKIDYTVHGWKCNLPEIRNVIYNMPATIIEWSDGTKTVSKCEDGEIFDREKGLMAAYMQKMESIKGRKLWKTLSKWLPKGLDMDNEPVNENMSTYVQSKLSRDHEKACKKLNKQFKDYKILTKEEAEYIKNDIIATADAAKAVYQQQADIDDDRTKKPALEKKDQLNKEFDKMMNPPVDNDTPEWNKWSLRKDRPLNKTTVNRHKYLPVLESHDGFDRYEKSSYLTPSEASKWLRENDHDIVVAIDEFKGIYYTGEYMSWQLMSRIIESIDTHDIHNDIFNRHKEMIYPPIESWESLNGKPRKNGTPDKLINFEYLCLMVVR